MEMICAIIIVGWYCLVAGGVDAVRVIGMWGEVFWDVSGRGIYTFV